MIQLAAFSISTSYSLVIPS